MTDEELYELADETAAKLAEHCDAVEIMLSRTENGGTAGIHVGRGDWYARQGLAAEFVASDNNKDLARRIGENLEPPPDGSEEWKNE